MGTTGSSQSRCWARSEARSGRLRPVSAGKTCGESGPRASLRVRGALSVPVQALAECIQCHDQGAVVAINPGWSLTRSFIMSA